MSTDRIESAIDEVARDMTSGEPGPGFTTQLLARIESGDAPRRAWRAAWTMAPLVGATAIAIAMVVARGVQPGDHAIQTSTRHAGTPLTIRQNPDTTLAPAIAAALPGGVVKTGKPDTSVTATSSPLARRGFAGATNPDATDIPRLELRRLAVDALTQPSLAADPIGTISPIDVAPLGTDDIQRRQE